MSIKSLPTGILAVALTCIGFSASAQDAFLGKAEFVQRCAVCHGEEGAGDGMVGELFATRPKDLRILARGNGGMFPLDAVYESIDGRRDVTAHGWREMPIWGDYLNVEALENRNISAADAAMVVDARIIALALYIQSIQIP